jgi:hypothetical protein
MARRTGERASTQPNLSDRRRQFVADWAAFSGSPGEGNIGGATNESVAELQLVVEMLLLGWVDPKTGEHRYFKSDSREERAARHAVAYLLRNPKPIDPWIRNRLADLFDPTSIYARDLKLGFRGEGRRSERLKHRRIASEMRRIVRAGKNKRGTVQAAIDAAVEKYGLEVRQARKIWSRYGKPMMS